MIKSRCDFHTRLGTKLCSYRAGWGFLFQRVHCAGLSLTECDSLRGACRQEQHHEDRAPRPAVQARRPRPALQQDRQDRGASTPTPPPPSRACSKKHVVVGSLSRHHAATVLRSPLSMRGFDFDDRAVHAPRYSQLRFHATFRGNVIGRGASLIVSE